MSEEIDTNALVTRVLLMLGILSLGFATGVYVTLQAVLANLKPLPEEQEVIIRVGADLYGTVASMQGAMQYSLLCAALLLIGGAVLGRREQLRAWYQGVAADG